MIDTRTVNLLQLIGSSTTLRKVAGTGGGEYHGPCPFCGGRDRFSVQPHHPNGGRWFCRQCAPAWYDAIEYVKRRDGVSFREALAILGLEQSTSHQVSRRPRTTNILAEKPYVALQDRDKPALQNEAWQDAARAFCNRTQEVLWSRSGKDALAYLRTRGLDDETIQSAQLGFCPTGQQQDWGGISVFLPQGIVIPWLIDNRIWKVNFRLLHPKGAKYTEAKGGAQGLYGADHITPGCAVVMVEGEFDCLLLEALVRKLQARQAIIVVATGSATKGRYLRWVVEINSASHILIAFDADKEGEKASAWWAQQFSSKVERILPLRHDITDMYLAGDNITAWIASRLF